MEKIKRYKFDCAWTDMYDKLDEIVDWINKCENKKEGLGENSITGDAGCTIVGSDSLEEMKLSNFWEVMRRAALKAKNEKIAELEDKLKKRGCAWSCNVLKNANKKIGELEKENNKLRKQNDHLLEVNDKYFQKIIVKKDRECDLIFCPFK
jgi:hypothetical protein